MGLVKTCKYSMVLKESAHPRIDAIIHNVGIHYHIGNSQRKHYYRELHVTTFPNYEHLPNYYIHVLGATICVNWPYFNFFCLFDALHPR